MDIDQEVAEKVIKSIPEGFYPVCPKCGSRVVIPSIGLNACLGNSASTFWCTDHGQWVGLLGECKHKALEPTNL